MYKSIISHLHSVFEGPGSISGYAYEASRYDIDVVWLSDHDDQMAVLWGVKRPPFKELDCKNNDNQYLHFAESIRGNPKEWSFGHQPQEECFLFYTRNRNGWGGGEVVLTGEKSCLRRPLFTEPIVSLKLDTDIQPDDEYARFCLQIPLNQTPPDHSHNSLIYYLGRPVDAPHSFPLAERKQGDRYLLDLARDAESAGLDIEHNAREYVFILESRENDAAVKLKELRLDTTLTESRAWQECQADIARQVEKKYGVRVICGYEFSAGEKHMCYYGSPAPVYPYLENPKPSIREMTSYAQGNGGITCYNHPLSAKNKDVNEQEKEQMLKEKIQELISNEAGGASLIEIGFPEGRRGFTLKQHLRLWDALNLAGLRIYGIGVSDSHSNVPWEHMLQGNNFASYVHSENCNVENLTAGLRAGRFFMADPVIFRGDFSLITDEGKTMGDIQTDGEVFLKVTGIPQNSALTWVIDGKSVREEPADGNVESICRLEGEHFIRAEIKEAGGRTIILTNPIWLTSS